MDKPYPNERDCEHGQHRKSCNICEYERDIAALKKEVEVLRPVHYHARGLMRNNGVDSQRATDAYNAMACAVHCVNEFDDEGVQDEEETSPNDLRS